jgi:hypothetical protein
MVFALLLLREELYLKLSLPSVSQTAGGEKIMRSHNNPYCCRYFVALLTASVLCLSPLSGSVRAQSGGTIDAGVNIPVRTNEEINVSKSDGRVFTGSVDEDVRDSRGGVALPRGTYVELLVRSVGEKEYALDLESVTVNGRRLAVEADNAAVAEERKEGIGANSRTGKYIGGGAAIGAVIGAITGGKKGAAIGGAVGAAGGAGVQVLTRGKTVKVPSESLVTFRLEQPLRTGVQDRGFSRNGWHYHPGYGTEAGNTAAFDAGLQAGRADRQRNRPFNSSATSWRGAELNDYQDGYERGFDESAARNSPADVDVRIGYDRNITWKGPKGSQVFVSMDDAPKRLFAEGASGTQAAPWIMAGHKYVFTLEDARGRELARDVNDLRQRRRR